MSHCRYVYCTLHSLTQWGFEFEFEFEFLV
jgi:hypothetical protein